MVLDYARGESSTLPESSFQLITLSRFGFVKYFTYEDCENCIRGFFHLGYQASYAQVGTAL